jgi:hypothetical protein
MSTKLEASPQEIKAIKQFQSADTTRPHMATVWLYGDGETGLTYFATDGHTMIVRTSGSHMSMSYDDICKLTPVSIGLDTQGPPPKWSTLLARPSVDGKHPEARGINPAYVGRVAMVERAAGKRAAESLEKTAGMTGKVFAQKKRTLLENQFAVWTIPPSPFDPWHFSLAADEAMWVGLIMPRCP